MELGDLIETLRQRADDKVSANDADGEGLYTRADMVKWAQEAEDEACLRARLLYDDTSSFLTLPVVADQAVYAIDPRIIAIDRISHQPTSGRARDLELKGIDAIEDHCDWRTRTGRPCLAAHFEKLKFRVWPTPTSANAGSLLLAVYRTPLDPMEGDGDEPEIAREHHEGLVNWMLYRCYSSKDQELEDPARAALALDRFEKQFGKRPDANVLRKHRERRRVTSRYGGY